MIYRHNLCATESKTTVLQDWVRGDLIKWWSVKFHVRIQLNLNTKKEIIYFNYCRVPQVPTLFRFAVVKHQKKKERFCIMLFLWYYEGGRLDKQKRQRFQSNIMLLSALFTCVFSFCRHPLYVSWLPGADIFSAISYQGVFLWAVGHNIILL